VRRERRRGSVVYMYIGRTFAVPTATAAAGAIAAAADTQTRHARLVRFVVFSEQISPAILTWSTTYAK